VCIIILQDQMSKRSATSSLTAQLPAAMKRARHDTDEKQDQEEKNVKEEEIKTHFDGVPGAPARVKRRSVRPPINPSVMRSLDSAISLVDKSSSSSVSSSLPSSVSIEPPASSSVSSRFRRVPLRFPRTRIDNGIINEKVNTQQQAKQGGCHQSRLLLMR